MSPLGIVISHNWCHWLLDPSPWLLRTIALFPRGLPPNGHQIWDGVGPLSSGPFGSQLIPSECLGNNKQKGEQTLVHVSLLPIATLTKQEKCIREEEGYMCESQPASVYGCPLEVFGEMTNDIQIFYINMHWRLFWERATHSSFSLKSSIRTSHTLRIWGEKQRECINMTVRTYFPLPPLQQTAWQLWASHQKQTSWYLLQI